MAIARARVSIHKHRSLTNMPRIPASCSLIGWECLGSGLLGKWMGDQTGLLSAERWTERVDRDGWIEEKMKERVWSESGRGQAQERPVLVYQRIPRFFPLFAFFISLTPAQYKSFLCVCENIGKIFLSKLKHLTSSFPFFLLLLSFCLPPAFVAFPTEPLHCNAPTVFQNNKRACYGPLISLSFCLY